MHPPPGVLKAGMKVRGVWSLAIAEIEIAKEESIAGVAKMFEIRI